MKKRYFLTVFSLLLILTFLGPIPAFAANNFLYSSQSSEALPLRADEYITYYRIYNGVRQYRIWNATDAVWVTPWLDCE